MTTLQKLQNTLSMISAVVVEITIRGEKKFTFSFEGENKKAAEAIKKYFAGHGKMTYDYDQECDHTALYLDI